MSDAAKQKDWDKEEAALRSAEELPVRVNGTDDDLPVQVNGTTEELPVQVNGTAEELPVRVTAEEEEEDKEGGKLSREEEGLINCLDSLRLDQVCNCNDKHITLYNCSLLVNKSQIYTDRQYIPHMLPYNYKYPRI